jgi:hypothetical protein
MKRSTTASGYGWVHQQVRARWAPLVARGEVVCARCGRAIALGTPWDMGHSDFDRSVYSGPEHRRCNRSAGARKATALRRRRAQTQQTMWTRW